MVFVLSLLAAFACALCYGVSSVLQKVGADTQKRATSLSPGLLMHLLRNVPYVAGTALEILVWPLTIVAAHNLPLFVVEPIVSLSVIFTVVVERLFLGRRVGPRTLIAIAAVGVGLVVIASQAHVQTAQPLSGVSEWLVFAGGPLLFGLLGAYLARLKGRASTLGLAVCAGASFGGSGVASRVFQLEHPLWHNLYQPAFMAMAAYGLIAVMLFTLALQRAQASIVNATVVGMETLLPTFVGIGLLGDSTRSGSYVPLAVGAALTILGTIAVTLSQPARRTPRRAI